VVVFQINGDRVAVEPTEGDPPVLIDRQRETLRLSAKAVEACSLDIRILGSSRLVENVKQV